MTQPSLFDRIVYLLNTEQESILLLKYDGANNLAAMKAIFLHDMWSKDVTRLLISTVPSVECRGVLPMHRGKYFGDNRDTLRENLAFQTRECIKNIVEFNTTVNSEEAKFYLLQACGAKYEIDQCEKKLNASTVVEISTNIRNVRRRLFPDTDKPTK